MYKIGVGKYHDLQCTFTNRGLLTVHTTQSRGIMGLPGVVDRKPSARSPTR